MSDLASITISSFALVISAVNAWMTLLRHGTVKMTQPTIIFFGPDAPRPQDSAPSPKIYLRTLLFSTSKKGCVLENMYVSLSRNETQQNFSVWVYGDESLVRGSGLFVGETGIATNHHFLLPPDNTFFQFVEGYYRLEVYAKILGEEKTRLLFTQTLEISPSAANALKEQHAGVYFDWGPDSGRYFQHVEMKKPKFGLDDLVGSLNKLAEVPVSKKNDSF